MIFTTDNRRVLTDQELEELRRSTTDHHLTILFEMYDDSVSRDDFDEVEAERDDLADQVKSLELERDELKAKLASRAN